MDIWLMVGRSDVAVGTDNAIFEVEVNVEEGGLLSWFR